MLFLSSFLESLPISEVPSSARNQNHRTLSGIGTRLSQRGRIPPGMPDLRDL
jgi:hypothetical protein